MNVVITGASKGIGHALALEFARMKDVNMLLIARSTSLLMELKAAIHELAPGCNVEILDMDLTSGEIGERIYPLIHDKMPGIDILVNNAGLLVNKDFSDYNDVDFDAMFSVNVKAPFKIIQALLPVMKSGSHIVNISSMGGYQGSVKFPGLSLYSASKGALAVLSECLAEELKPLGISVNALALGSVDTEMVKQAFPGFQAQLSAEQMASYICGFACNGHRYYNGKVLPVSISTP